jgi:hypothetical protein
MASQITFHMIFKNRDAAFKNHEAAGHSVKEQGVVEAQLPVSSRWNASIAKDLATEFLAELLIDAKGRQVSESFTVGGDA